MLPSEEVTSEQIEDMMAMLSEMGINVIDNEEDEEEDSTESSEEGRARRPEQSSNDDDDPLGASRADRRPCSHVPP